MNEHEQHEVIPGRFCNRWVGGSRGDYCGRPAVDMVSPGRGVSQANQYRCERHLADGRSFG